LGIQCALAAAFFGLGEVQGRKLMAAMAGLLVGLIAAAFGYFAAATLLLFGASAAALHIFRPSHKPPKTIGVSPLFPLFVRTSYGWLLVAAALGIYAAYGDVHTAAIRIAKMARPPKRSVLMGIRASEPSSTGTATSSAVSNCVR
jgi:hypothetical protein